MTKKLITSTLVLCALASCATNQETKELSLKKEDPIIGDIGSANDADKGARLDFLTKTITEKRAKLLMAKKANRTTNTEQTQLEVEILDNEILLLEAEMFGLQEGMDLNPTEL